MIRPFLLLLTLVTLAAEDAWPMRWRVTADSAAGLAFRHPYELLPADLGATALVRIDRRGRQRAQTPALRWFDRPGDDPRAAGAAEAGGTPAWTSWTLPEGPRPASGRPAVGGPVAVLGTLGSGPGRTTVLAIARQGRTVGLVLAGGPEEGDNPGILASVEVLAPAAKGRPAAATRRDQGGRGGAVLDAQGRWVDARPKASGKTSPVPWPQAWEVETEHYHVTGNTSPVRLAWHGRNLEALYRAYQGIYQPERMPATKFEVHVFDRQEEFHQAAAAWGHDGVGPGVLGFFSPSMQSLWVYEESEAVAGPEFAVQQVMAHECSHQFLHLATNGNRTVPTWLNEGLAVHFESGVFRDGQFQIRPPSRRLDRLKRQYQERGDTLVPLADYIGHRHGIDGDQYAEVWAMTHFWLFGACKGPQCRHQDCGLARFRRYWNDLKAGADGEAAFERHFLADMITAKGGRDQALAAWKTALLAYVKTLK